MFPFVQNAVLAALRLWFLAARIFCAFTIVLLGSLFRALMRNMKLRRVPKEEAATLRLPLLASRLTDLPYLVDATEAIEAGVHSLLTDATLLHFEEQPLMSTNAVWFLAEAVDVERPTERALYLVFRGTNSPTDAIADVLFRPDDAPNGVQCHGGFLRTVRDDKSLHATLAQHAAGDMALYVMGHSLGGALSQTLVGAGLLPQTFAGRLTVVTLGGPVVFYGAVEPSMLPEVAVGARVLSVVNANDIVPRLLGCPLSFTRRLLVLFASSASPRQQQRNEAILDTLEQYNGFPQEELLFLHGGAAFKVARDDRMLVMSLAEAIHPRLVADHLAYVAAAEAAAGAPAWSPPAATTA